MYTPVSQRNLPRLREKFALAHWTKVQKAGATRGKISQAGFTLIEVLISIFLLVIISLSIYQTTTQTYKYRDILIREGDFYNGIRLAVGLIERDIEQMYSPVLMNPNYKPPGITGGAVVPGSGEEDFNQNPFAAPGQRPPSSRQSGSNESANSDRSQILQNLLMSELGQNSDHWLGATDITGIRPSRFVGEANRLRFITSSHQRLYKGTQESTFAKVLYELREDTGEDRIEGTKVLVRVEDPNVFDDLEKRLKWAKTYPLLTGVKSLKFRFYRLDRKAWETSWDNIKEDQRGLYPDLVEVSIEVTASARLNFQGTYIFRPELPFRGLPNTF